MAAGTALPDTGFAPLPPGAPAPAGPPRATGGALGWMRTNLFSSPANTVVTVLTLALLALDRAARRWAGWSSTRSGAGSRWRRATRCAARAPAGRWSGRSSAS